MRKTYLLDTNAVSEAFKEQAHPGLLQKYLEHRAVLVTSSITIAELRYGLATMTVSKKHHGTRQRIEAAIKLMDALPFDKAAAGWHGEERGRLERKGLTPSLFDSMIAAVAVVNGLILVTRNVKDFTPFKGLKVENWMA